MSAKDTDKIKKIVEEEVLEAIINYNVEFEFDHICSHVQIVYVRELRSSPEPAEYHMLENLSKRISEINPRYKIGIIFEDLSMIPISEDFEQIQKEIDRLDRENSKLK